LFYPILPNGTNIGGVSYVSWRGLHSCLVGADLQSVPASLDSTDYKSAPTRRGKWLKGEDRWVENIKKCYRAYTF